MSTSDPLAGFFFSELKSRTRLYLFVVAWKGPGLDEEFFLPIEGRLIHTLDERGLRGLARISQLPRGWKVNIPAASLWVDFDVRK